MEADKLASMTRSASQANSFMQAMGQGCRSMPQDVHYSYIRGCERRRAEAPQLRELGAGVV